MPDYKPSDVVLRIMPLVGTMKKAEVEFAAALLVRACVRNNDSWAPILPKEMGEAIKQDLDEKIEPLFSLNQNPIFRPDLHMLIERGFAEVVGGDKNRGPLQFTQVGFDAMSKWVRL